MTRPAWSRWTCLVLALAASLVSPGLAVAHGVAHWHNAASHHTNDRVGAVHDDAHDHDSHDEGHGHHHVAERQHETGGDHAPGLDHDEEHSVTASAPDHAHAHEHARLEPLTAGRTDARDSLAAPVLIVGAPTVPEVASLIDTLRSRWDTVSLARPAPDSGPPPALRAPPTR
jgi:hypothetical protein